MEKNKIAVVTGGAGFIGSHLVDALIEKGYTVRVIDNLVAGKKENVNPKAELYQLDIRHLKDIAPVFQDVDHVFHFAALPRVQFSIDSPLESHDVNVNGTLSVFIAARDAKVKKVVYSASGSAYGEGEVPPFHEELKANPISPYGLHKYVGEHYARIFSLAYGLPTVSLRYFNVYGSRVDPEGPYALVVAKFLEQRKAGVPLTITGDGEQTRDFTHVRDVVRANLLAAESDNVRKGEVMNIGAGKSVSVNYIAKLVGGARTYIPARLEPRHSEADHTLATKLIGWKPEVAIEGGVRELLLEWGITCACEKGKCTCALGVK